MLARWWKNENNRVLCTLCPWECSLKNEQTGVCGVRKVIDNQLISLNYGYPVAINIDPMEKKPLYHFLPGEKVFSIGTLGCNLKCSFCQNWEISQTSMNDYSLNINYIKPESIVSQALKSGSKAIAFTYNEPTIFAEYLYDIAEIAHEQGLKTVMVSNGYISESALPEVYKYIDAANIDLKSMEDAFYKKMTGGRRDAVLNTIRMIHELGIHLEITTMIIDGINSDNSMLNKEFQWIVDMTGTDTPLHLSAFHPQYKMDDYPATRRDTLLNARELAKHAGLKYVYIGNVPQTDNNTYCNSCRKMLVQREGYRTRILQKDRCECGEKINIIFD